MIDRNGGYAIIDLKGKTLSAVSTTILGTHSAIAKAIAGSKPILLSGLTTGGPCFVQVTKSGTSYVIPNVYGKNITITSADGVTVANVKIPELLTFVLVTDAGAFSFGYEKGMTFAQFAASDYNVGDAVTITESNVNFGGDSLTKNNGNDDVAPTDDIQEASAAGILVGI